MRLNIKLSNILAILFLAFTCVGAEAAVFVSVGIPAPQAVYVVPAGYANCYRVPAGVYNGFWMNSHRVCRGPNGMWIEGYHQCYSRNIFNGRCTSWVWRPAYTVYPGNADYNFWWGWGGRHGWWGPAYYHGWGPGPRPMPGPMPGPYYHHHWWH